MISFRLEGTSDPDAVRKALAAAAPRSVVQAFRAKGPCNAFYLEMIAAQTLRAVGTPNLLARKPEVDLLLRLAGTTQISRAIAEVGARKGQPFIVTMAGPTTTGSRLSLRRIGGTRLKRSKLTPGELDRIEAAALLNVSRA